jgi:hypothetical protein
MRTLEMKQREDGVFELPIDAILAEVKAGSAPAILEQDKGVATLEGVGGMLQKAVDFKFAGIPLGAGVVGGATAYALASGIDWALTKTADKTTGKAVIPVWAADLLAAAGIIYAGKKFAAIRPAANLAAMFLVYEAARGTVEPAIDKLIHPKAAAGQSRLSQPMQQAMNQAVAKQDYYGAAFGGRR